MLQAALDPAEGEQTHHLTRVGQQHPHGRSPEGIQQGTFLIERRGPYAKAIRVQARQDVRQMLLGTTAIKAAYR